MSDIGGGGGGEPSIGGTANIAFSGQTGGLFGRRGRTITGTASAALKFDIPGLQAFRTELGSIRKALEDLNTTFGKLATAPTAWAKSLEAVNAQLKALKTNSAGIKGIPGVGGTGTGTGTTGQIPENQGSLFTPSGGRAANMMSKVKGMFGGGGAAEEGAAGEAGAAGAMGAGAAASGGMAVGQMLSNAAQAMFDRFNSGMDEGTQADLFQSRRALALGKRSQSLFTEMGQRGFGFGPKQMPFLPSSQVEAAQVLAGGQSIGAFYGEQGLAGQRGQAYAQSIGQMQNLNPGMSAGQAASSFAQGVSNVKGIQQGISNFGFIASPYKKGGGLKTQQEMFTDFMTILKNQPRIDSTPRGTPFSKETLELMSTPGSNANSVLSAMGMTDDQAAQFWSWAIADASVQAAGQGPLTGDINKDKPKIEKVTGERLGVKTMESQALAAQRGAAFTGEQYGTMLTRQDMEQSITRLLDGLDSWLQGLYNVTGRAPKGVQGVITKGIQLGASLPTMLVAGDPGYADRGGEGYMGDPEKSLSHLTPDLRQRVGRMMGDNPNLQINSAYRDNLRQTQLQGKGPFAPSGKSMHGRGQAIDLGPSSQHGWLATNAQKYGLGTAGHMGEPWHVQLAGSMGFMGDPMSPSDQARANEAQLSSNYLALWGQLMSNLATTGKSGQPANNSGNSGGGTAGSSTSGGGSTTDTSGSAVGLGPAGGLDVSSLQGKSTAMTFAEVGKVAYAAGFRGNDLVTMMAIAKRESGLNPSSWVEDSDDVGGGLWAINQLPYIKKGITPPYSKAQIQDPVQAAQIAYSMFKSRGFQPWDVPKSLNAFPNLPPYLGGSKNDNAQEYMDTARAEAKAAGLLGDIQYGNPDGQQQAALAAMAYNGGSQSGGGTVSVKSSPVSFTNTFNITMSGSRSDVDVATKQIAARLEAQMQRTVSRRS